ncbi:MAG: 2-amino-4-hydroxy-6-hydroxymethyldihydropteridine diphosphokinase [Candidatus Dormibacteraeota bacterium]|nr:2-amino-4-hydroxy-6-hydroxymethyldihydropteridine diphosphokinase [Candidatus Dormibacteraeota bacterium]MBV9526091.1 2-amino-4-hydroxy-6-hydroxymethyldihydropteridine diphosphokinase [Candidatus Dormibacteraeota bacterium]
MTSVAWILLGSNVGHRGRALACLRDALQRDGVVVQAASSEILTRPVGVTAQQDFHNQVVRVRAPEPWPAERWLAHCKAAERHCGRRETYRWGPRAADADILLLGEHGEVRVDTPELSVPHPQLDARPFVQRLLRELGG